MYGRHEENPEPGTQTTRYPEDTIFCDRALTEENKRKNKCVTIFTWPGNEISSEPYWHNGTGTRGRLGHSALKTYGNTKGEAGIYVSFYPGECHRNDHTPTCKKSVSHFHRWNQEMSKEVKSRAKAFDLEGLDVDAIHAAFQEMHDGEMNSRKKWGPRYNCSDVVLLLLEKGKLFEKKNRNPFFLLFGSILGAVGITFLGIRPDVWKFYLSLPAAFTLNYLLFPEKRDLAKREAEPYLAHLWPEFNICSRLFSIGVIFSSFNYYTRSFKDEFYLKGCLIFATKIGVIGLFPPLIDMSLSIMAKKIPAIRKPMHYTDLSVKVMMWPAVIVGYLYAVLDDMAQRGCRNLVRFVTWDRTITVREPLPYYLQQIPFLILFFPLAQKYIFDTTTTPNHLLNIIEPLKKKLIEEKKENQDLDTSPQNEIAVKDNKGFLNRAYENRYTPGIAGLLVAGGFFAYKALSAPSGSPLETLSSTI